MAIVPARLSLELYDAQGAGGTFLVHMAVDDTSTLAEANTAIGSFKTAFQTVSNAGIKRGQFTLLNKAVAADPDPSSVIGVGAVYNFSNAALAPQTAGILIPSYLDSLVEPNGSINIAGTVQAAFIASVLDAYLGGTVTDAAYLDLVEGIDAFRTNRKRRLRLRP